MGKTYVGGRSRWERATRPGARTSLHKHNANVVARLLQDGARSTARRLAPSLDPLTGLCASGREKCRIMVMRANIVGGAAGLFCPCPGGTANCDVFDGGHRRATAHKISTSPASPSGQRAVRWQWRARATMNGGFRRSLACIRIARKEAHRKHDSSRGGLVVLPARVPAAQGLSHNLARKTIWRAIPKRKVVQFTKTRFVDKSYYRLRSLSWSSTCGSVYLCHLVEVAPPSSTVMLTVAVSRVTIRPRPWRTSYMDSTLHAWTTALE